MKKSKKLLILSAISLLAVSLVVLVCILTQNRRTDERSVGVSDYHPWSHNVEILEWGKNGFIGKDIDTNEKVRIDLVTEKGTITQPDGSVYPNCRYNIGTDDTTSREYKKSKMQDNWFLSAYSEWEEKQYDVGDTVHVLGETVANDTEYETIHTMCLYPPQ